MWPAADKLKELVLGIIIKMGLNFLEADPY
jgi:hypothetical protein